MKKKVYLCVFWIDQMLWNRWKYSVHVCVFLVLTVLYCFIIDIVNASANMFKSASRNSQLLLLDQKCAKCLLETYVKRSLSLNEGCRKHQLKLLKRVKRDERGSQARRAASDPSTHCLSKERLLKSKCPECTTSGSDLVCRGLKAPSKTKRRSLFRGFLNLFSKKKSDLKVNGEGVSEADCGRSTTERIVDASYERSRGHTVTLRKKHSRKHVEQRESLQTHSTPVPCGVEGLSDGESVRYCLKSWYFLKFYW